MPLTELLIRAEKPSEKTKRLSDAHGLYLLLNPDGSRWWRMDYRFAGKRKTLSLGTYPHVSLKDARGNSKMHEVTFGVVSTPARSVAQRRHRAKARTVSRRSPTNGSANSNRVGSIRTPNEFCAALSATSSRGSASKMLRGLKVQELLTVLRRIENRGAVETAHRALQNCSQIFRYAVATGRAERDVTADLRGAIPPSKAKYHAAITEPDDRRPTSLDRQLRRRPDYSRGSAFRATRIRTAWRTPARKME